MTVFNSDKLGLSDKWVESRCVDELGLVGEGL